MIMRSLSAVAAVFMVTLFSPLALFAAEKPVTFRGQTIYVKGAKYQNFMDMVGIHPTIAEEFTTLSVTKRSGASAKKGGC